MDRKYIEDRHIVARYLAGQLSDPERQSFEAYYLAHPDVVQDLEAVARLKVGLMRLEESGELGTLIAAPRRAPRNYYFLAAAAAVVAAVAVLFLYLRESPQRPMLAASAGGLVDRSGASLPVTATHLLMRTRSAASYDTEIAVGDSPQAIELRVLPEVEAQPPRYHVELASAVAGSKPRVVAAVGDLAPGEDGFVPVYLDASGLKPGTYVLTIAGEAGSSASSEFVIDLQRAGPPGR
ncbi:MAG TPA: hypothetical protein VJQ52_15235 [Steroidobacteraceae bacterium]|nr:hypothetical protein [Steroidobacteraceae bacterium]